jgi:excisionase family DNA binding protein
VLREHKEQGGLMSIQEAAPAQDAIAVRPAKAAEMLDVSRATIYNLIAQGELRSFRVGQSRRILLAEIAAYITRQQAQEIAS